MENQSYTWKEFVDVVRGLMPVEAKRVGIQDASDGTPGYLTRTIRQAVIELQNKVPQYRIGHETIYHPEDLVSEGQASRGVKPPESVIRKVSLVKRFVDAATGEQTALRYPTVPWNWEDRFALVQGKVAVNNNQGRYCPDPQGYTFYVYPEMTAEWVVSIFWDGLKLDFQDDEQVPFDEAMAGAVALYVKAQVKREVEENLQLYQSFMGEYLAKVPTLYLREREKTQPKA